MKSQSSGISTVSRETFETYSSPWLAVSIRGLNCGWFLSTMQISDGRHSKKRAFSWLDKKLALTQLKTRNNFLPHQELNNIWFQVIETFFRTSLADRAVFNSYQEKMEVNLWINNSNFIKKKLQQTERLLASEDEVALFQWYLRAKSRKWRKLFVQLFDWATLWPDEKDLFLRLFIWNNSKFPYEKLTLSLGKLYQNFFLFHTVTALVTLHTEFGLIWTTPWDYFNHFTSRNSGIACLGKKVSFSYGNSLIFQINIFKNRSFSSGQAVVQIERNSVWTIPYVPKV